MRPIGAAPAANRAARTERLAKRNEALVARYYYYSEVKGLKAEVTIRELSQDFFLSEFTVWRLLEQNMQLIDSMIKRRPSVNDVKQANERFAFNITQEERRRYE